MWSKAPIQWKLSGWNSLSSRRKKAFKRNPPPAHHRRLGKISHVYDHIKAPPSCVSQEHYEIHGNWWTIPSSLTGLIFKFLFLLNFICFYFLATSWGMRDLSSPIRDRTCIPCIGRGSLNYWTSREVPRALTLIHGLESSGKRLVDRPAVWPQGLPPW